MDFEYDDGQFFKEEFNLSNDSKKFFHTFNHVENTGAYMRSTFLKRKLDIKLSQKPQSLIIGPIMCLLAMVLVLILRHRTLNLLHIFNEMGALNFHYIDFVIPLLTVVIYVVIVRKMIILDTQSVPLS